LIKTLLMLMFQILLMLLKLLHSIFKDDLKSINYWLKHLDIVNNLDLL